MSKDRVFGIVREISLSELTIVTKDDREINYKIKEPWTQFIKFIKIYDEVFVETDKGSQIIDSTALLVIDPRYLVSVTETIKAIACPRKVYVRHMGASASYDPMLHQMQVKGNLLHDVFTNKLVHQNSVQDAISQTLDNNKLDLILADFDMETARTYLHTNAMVLKSFPITGESEIDVRHYGYGLAGKLDALTSSDMIVELKSSRIPDAHPAPDHNIQMNMYQKMMEDYLDEHPKGKVLYISDGSFGLKNPTDWSHQKTIIARNYSYLVLTGKYQPPVLRGEKKKECKRCYRKEGCMSLCAGLVHQRDCEQCYHDSLCSKMEWPIEKYDLFSTFSEATIFEELEVKAEEYYGHRSSFSSNDGVDTLIGTKLDETTTRSGSFITEYSFKQNDTSYRQGDYVTVYPNTKSGDVEISYAGILFKIEPNRVLVQSKNTLPDKVEIFPSTTSSLLRRSRENLYKTMLSESKIIEILLDLLSQPDFNDTKITLPKISDEISQLQKPLMEYNYEQEIAIKKALDTPDFYLIQGPAGTGKTSVIIEIVNQLVQRGKSILVSAFTNMAVDNVGLNLHEHGIPFIRLGTSTSTSPKLRGYTVEKNSQAFEEFTENRQGKVILSTTTTIGRNTYDDLFFDYVLIDEASQMTLPSSLMPILHGEKFVLVGDHAQLPPIVISDDASDLGYDKSLFERLTEVSTRFTMLRDQYRMSDQILSFPNKKFYNGQLRSANREIAEQSLDYTSDLLIEQSFQLVALEDMHQSLISQSNYYESVLTCLIVEELVNQAGILPDDIGVITPFRAQVAQLRSLIPNVKIDTIDRFQGSEAEVIIFSTCSLADIPLLTDPRRLNVALTRGKKKLIVLQTNPSLLKQTTLQRELYRDAFRRGYFTQVKSKQFSAIEDKVTQIVETRGKSLKKADISTRQKVTGKILFYNSIALLPITLSSEERCLICYQMLKTGLQCPGCGYTYHETQLLKWVMDNDKCPTCKHRLYVVNT